MNRAGKVEKEVRIFKIQGWIVDGVQDYLILKQCKTEFGISLRQARKYLIWAYKAWKQDAQISIELKRSTKIAELKQLKRTLKSDFKGTPAGIKAIMTVEKEIIKLENITPPKIHVHHGDPEKPLMPNPTIIIKERGK